MATLTLMETLKMMEDNGFKLSKRTFEYYQGWGLLPKPEKHVGKRGRGLYGFYDSETILKAAGFIFTMRRSGVRLYKINQEAMKSVVYQFQSHLKKWGFSDYSLSEMKSSDVPSSDRLGKIFIPTDSRKVEPVIIPVLKPVGDVLGGELTKAERTDFERDLIEKAKFWETDKIETMALQHINNEAEIVVQGVLISERYFQEMRPFLTVDSNTFKQILKTIEDRLRDIYLLMTMVDRRFAEINGRIFMRKSAPYWRQLSERFEAATVTRKGEFFLV